ncbi:unnamed protein product, partial [Vitis vinifera]
MSTILKSWAPIAPHHHHPHRLPQKQVIEFECLDDTVLEELLGSEDEKKKGAKN